MKDNVLEIPIDDLEISKWDVRRYGEIKEKFNALVECIKNEGLYNPLTVIKSKDNSKYTVVAGRRRLKALKQLGYKSVPVFIATDKNSVAEQRKKTLFENLHRNEINDTEKGFGILAVYKDEGYSDQQAFNGTRIIDNWFHHNKVEGNAWETLGKALPKNDELKYKFPFNDEIFMSVCKSIGYTPKYQYQKLQLTRDVGKKALAKAEELGLPTDKKTMLTKFELRDHPELQEEIVEKIASMDKKQAETYIDDVAKDIKSGRIEKVGKGYVVHDKNHSDESIKPAKQVLSNPSDNYLDIIDSCKQFIFETTGRAKTKGEFGYTEETVFTDKTKEHQIAMVKSLADRELINMDESMYLVGKLATQIFKLLEQEIQSRKLTKELLTK